MDIETDYMTIQVTMPKYKQARNPILEFLRNRFQTLANDDEDQSQKNSDIDWWPCFHHDLYNTGTTTSAGPETNNLLWSFAANDNIDSSSAVVDGKVYFGSWDNNLYCLDADNGDLIWSYTAGNYFHISTPAVVNGKVYIGSTNGPVYCLDADTGDLIWDYNTGGHVPSSPTLGDGHVYIGSMDGNMYCLDADTGTLIWSYSTNDEVYSSPAIADGKVYVGCYNKKVYCLNADTGDLIWDYTADDEVWDSPSVANGKVYIGDYSGKVYCFGSSNEPPETPTVTGTQSGKVGIEYTYTASSTDPEGDPIEYLFDWDDGETTGWQSDSSASHTWESEGDYTVTVKARDDKGDESDWGSFQVSMPKTKHFNHPLIWFLENHPHLFPLLRLILI